MAAEEDFSFAFDNMAFSDRLLRIEIMSDVIDDRQSFSPISTPDIFKDPFQRSSDGKYLNYIFFPSISYTTNNIQYFLYAI